MKRLLLLLSIIFQFSFMYSIDLVWLSNYDYYLYDLKIRDILDAKFTSFNDYQKRNSDFSDSLLAQFYYFRNNTSKMPLSNERVLCVSEINFDPQIKLNVKAKCLLLEPWVPATYYYREAMLKVEFPIERASREWSKSSSPSQAHLEAHVGTEWEAGTHAFNETFYEIDFNDPIIPYELTEGSPTAYFNATPLQSDVFKNGTWENESFWWENDSKIIKYFLAKSAMASIECSQIAFYSDLNNKQESNMNFDFSVGNEIIIKTEYKVKSICTDLYKISNNEKILLDEFSFSNDIGRDATYSISKNGINELIFDSNKMNTLESGDYVLNIGIINKFNQREYYKPIYFTINSTPKFSFKQNEIYIGNQYRKYENKPINTVENSLQFKMKIGVDNRWYWKNKSTENINDYTIQLKNGDTVLANKVTVHKITKENDCFYIEFKVEFGVSDTIEFNTFYICDTITNAVLNTTSEIIVFKKIPELSSRYDVSMVLSPLGLKSSVDIRVLESKAWDTDEFLTTEDFNLDSQLISLSLGNGDGTIFMISLTDNKGLKHVIYATKDTNNKICYYKKDVSSSVGSFTLKYSDFFDSLGNTTIFPIDIFGQSISVSITSAKIVGNNFLNGIYTSNEEIELLCKAYDNFPKLFNSFDNSVIAFNKQEMETIKTLYIPAFPSRVVYTNIKSSGIEDPPVEVYMKPYFTDQLGENVKAYQIIVSNKELTDIDDTVFTYDSTKETILFPKDNIWSWNTAGYYVSSWIDNSKDASIVIGKSAYSSNNGIGTQFKYSSSSIDQSMHFYVKLLYADNSVSTAYRQTTLLFNKDFRVRKTAKEILNAGEVNEYIVLESDLYIPKDKTITFSANSGAETNLRNLPSLMANTSVRIIVDGTLIITNIYSDTKTASSRRVPLGPSGINDTDNNDTLWGGIIIRKGGKLIINGAEIKGAINGILLLNNSGGTATNPTISLENLDLKYNDIGLHLYNSGIGKVDNLTIEGNTLYGVKEEKPSKLSEDIKEKLKTGSTDNLYVDYYDYEKGDIIRVGE